jgi:hypothetical protein
MPDRRCGVPEGLGALPEFPHDPAAFIHDVRSDRVDSSDSSAILAALDAVTKAMNGRAKVQTIGEWVDAGDRATTAFMDAYAITSRYFSSDGLLEGLERLTGVTLPGAEPLKTKGDLFLASPPKRQPKEPKAVESKVESPTPGEEAPKPPKKPWRDATKTVPRSDGRPLRAQGIYLTHSFTEIEHKLHTAMHTVSHTEFTEREATPYIPSSIDDVLVDTRSSRWRPHDRAAFVDALHVTARNMAQSHGVPDGGTTHWSPAAREHIEASHRASHAFLTAHAIATKYYPADGLRHSLEHMMDMEIPALQDRHPIASEHREAVAVIRERLALLLHPPKKEDPPAETEVVAE